VRTLWKRFFLSISHFSGRLKEKGMSEIVILVGVFVVWLLLQAYVLPKLGIST
jgi:hypothetical protein